MHAVAERLSVNSGSKGLNVAVNILAHWNATTEQMAAILGVSTATISRAKRKDAVNLSRDQLERVSYVLNIHAALRTVFDNPNNYYGFVHKPNHNPFFNGRTPFDIMVEGSMANLYETFKRIDVLRGGLW